MRKIDLFCGDNWCKVSREYLEGVDKIDDIGEVYEFNERIKVVYKDGEEVWYQNVHGSWGFPTVVE